MVTHRSLNTKLEQYGLKIVKLLQQNGFKAFWVGGTVRDMIMGREINNLDIATSARPDDVEQILKKNKIHSKPAGKMFGTILALTKHGPIEITTFRKEGRYIDNRRPQDVVYIDDYVEDSMRRDLTINSIYHDPITKKTYDPQKGINDIDRKLVKFVGNPKKRIDEDALRMIRAVRFTMQLNFKLEKNSFAAIKTRAKYIKNISGERIKAELDKIVSLDNKAAGIRLLDDLGLLNFIMPEVSGLKNIFHKSKMYHLEGSVFEHTLLALHHTPNVPLLAYAALYHDAGKLVTGKEKKKTEGFVNSFPMHEFVSEKMFRDFATRIKMTRKDRNIGLWITKMHMTRVAFIKDMGESKKMALSQHKFFPYLVQIWKADSLANLRKVGDKILPCEAKAWKEGTKYLNNIKRKKKMFDEIANGKIIMQHLKIKSGPRVGKIKIDLKNKILSGEIKNINDAKKYLEKM